MCPLLYTNTNIAAMPDAVHINAKIIMYRVANMSMYNRR